METSLVILKPNKIKTLKDHWYQVMVIENIQNELAITSWINKEGIPFRKTIPLELLWKIDVDPSEY